MRIDDIFEAMTDIDDRFIEAARPLEPLHDGQPVSVAPAPRRARWKTIVPAAACIAAALTTAAVGGKYLYTKSLTAATNNSSLTFWYPEEAKYRVNGDVLLNCTSYTEQFGMLKNKFLIEENCAEDYAELAAQSDLIVAGEFVDAPHQIQDPEEIHLDQSLSFVTEEYSAEGSYNYLSVERVLKGDAEAGNFVLIRQEASLHKSSGGAYILFANDLLSPMIKGDKWVYFLKKTENGFYTPVNGPQGRYPMPENNNTGVSLEDDVKDDIDEFGALKGSPAANRAEIYAELIEVLNTENSPEIKQIGVPGESFNTFTIEEFEGVEFKVSRLGVTADDVEVFSMGDGRLDNLFLADLNGDGKRELCASITENGRRSAVVRDFENGDTYTLPYSASQEYILEVRDNALNVVVITHESIDLVSSTSKPLTFDMLVKEITYDTDAAFTEAVLDVNHTFTLPDFEGFEFNVDTSYEYPQFSFRWGSHGSANHVNNVYFSDLDGDGQREIILNCPFGDLGEIRIYGFMDNGEIGEAVYYENGGCRLVKADGKLNYKNESGEIPFEFSRSELKPMFEQKYSIELLDWDHQLIYKDIVPASGIFNIRIEERRLIIKYGGEMAFTSANDIGELFTIPDAENNRLIFVYSNETNDCIDAFSLSNHPEKLVCLNDANVVDAAPTDDNDVVIYFKDGRSVSINNILSCFETTDNS